MTQELIFYHGAKRPFNRFMYAMIDKGSGAAQEGVGFYLTTSPKDAAAYGNFILTVQTPKPKNLIPHQGRPNRTVLEKMIRAAPDAKETLLNWDENPRIGLQNAVNTMMQGDPHWAYQSVWYDFYRDNPGQYVKNMAKLGFDGVMVKRAGGIVHYIAFNTSALKIVDIKRLK